MAAKRANGKTLVEVLSPEAHVKVTDFQVISFFDKHAERKDGMVGSEVILIYALGEDGVIREFANGKWTAFPI